MSKILFSKIINKKQYIYYRIMEKLPQTLLGYEKQQRHGVKNTWINFSVKIILEKLNIKTLKTLEQFTNQAYQDENMMAATRIFMISERKKLKNF